MKKILLILLLLIAFNSYSQKVDKVAHFGVGYVIGATTSALTSKQTPLVCISIGVCSGFVVGTAKEIYDYLDYGKFNFKDLGATVLGSGLGSVTIRIAIK